MIGLYWLGLIGWAVARAARYEQEASDMADGIEVDE